MARIRTIKPELYEDEDLAELSLEAAHVVFPRLWQLADARGLLPCRPRFLTAECFRYRREYTVEQTEAYLRELEDVGAVFRYSAGNRDYIALPNFCRHQRIKADEWDALARQILAGQATPEPEGEDPTWPLDQVRHALARVIPKGAPQGVTWLPAEELPTRYRNGAATVPQRCRDGAATAPGTHRGVNRDGKGKGKGNGNGNGNGNGDSPPLPPQDPRPEPPPPSEPHTTPAEAAAEELLARFTKIAGKHGQPLRASKPSPMVLQGIARSLLDPATRDSIDGVLDDLEATGPPKWWSQSPLTLQKILEPKHLERFAAGSYDDGPGKARTETTTDKALKQFRGLRRRQGRGESHGQ